MQMLSSATFVDRLAGRSHRTAIRVAAMLFVTALTAAAAQISIPVPFSDVPFTFQPTVVLLGGLALGSRLGMGSQILYLLAGIAGLPVFAASVTLPPGALRLLGPTGGYLMSYPFAAFVAGYLAERGFDRRYVTSIIAMVVGLLVVYTCGTLWLGLFVSPSIDVGSGAIVLGAGGIGLRAALAAGVYPFVIADIVKLIVAAGVLPAFWRLTGSQGVRP